MKKKILYASLLAIVIIIGLLHFFTPGEYSFFHDTYRRLSYFPIVLGGLWFGVWGGLSLAVLSSLAFIPHLLLYLGHTPQSYLSELTEIILYIAAGAVTGFIAGREARLRGKYQDLSEKLEKSYRRLSRQAKILFEVEEQLGVSQRLSALGKLSASLAHEIKNPLSSIRGTAEIFLDEFPEGHPKREFAEILLKEVGRLNATVEEVLDFSRGGHGKSNGREALSAVISRVGKLIETHLRKKSVQLSLVGVEQGSDCLVDGAKFSQVFLNILLNSIDVLPPGGAITLRVERDDSGIAVVMCDNGPGVPEALREKIFDPFVTTKEDGTGLGLPISRRIVEGHGGTLTCGETPDHGACFTLFLPASADPSKKLLADD